MKIFFFGGTFDPPHKGHESIVNHALQLCDKLIIFPSKLTPGKKVLPKASINHRMNMLKLLFNDQKIKIDDFDLKQNKKNYTYLTVLYLKKIYRKSALTMIVGRDQLVNFHNWKNYKLINENVNIICYNRNIKHVSQKNKEYDHNAMIINEFDINISSTEIRNNINKFENNSDHIDSSIISYIKKNNLYV